MIAETTRTTHSHERARRAILAHFAAACRPEDERDMRAHLIGCADCRQVYDRRLLVATLDPDAVPAQERLARRLGFGPAAAAGLAEATAAAPPPRVVARRLRWPLRLGAGGLLGAVAVAAVVALAPRPSPRPRPPGVPGVAGDAADPVARGGAPRPALPELRVFRFPAGGKERAEGVARVVGAGDELAFAYRNPGGRRRLLVFAVDEHGHVYWYHPEWTRAEDNPSGVPISREPGLHELPAAVAQHFDGERLMIHALFTDRELTVRQVEAAFAGAAATGGQPRGVAFPDAIDVTYPLRVIR